MNEFVLSAPTIYSVELTSVCNNCCAGCSNVFARSRVPLSASGWRRVLDRIAPYAQSLKLTGGEPTLHREFEDIVCAIVDRDIPFTLFTNARWNNPQKTVDLLKATSQCGGLLISLHGPDAATHEAFTNTLGSFEETCVNIRHATAAGLCVHTSTVLTRHNWDRVQEIVAFAQEIGASCVVFNRYIGSVMPALEPDTWQLHKAMENIEASKRSVERSQTSDFSVKYGNCIPWCFAPSSSTGCWAGAAYCTIDPWGNMRPCNHSPLVVGNVLEQSIEELWHSKKMNNWRALLPPECKECSEFFSCRGGCRAMIEIRQSARDPLATQPLRDRRRDLREMVLFGEACPSLSCLVKPESFGYALIQGQSLYPVPKSAKPLLDALDGHNTLEEILHRFGQQALNLTGVLYEQGLVGLHQ